MVDPHYSRVPYLQIRLLAKIYLQPPIDTHVAFAHFWICGER